MLTDKQVFGTVKWFNNQLGYGFIDGPFCSGSYFDGTNIIEYAGTSYYAHYSCIAEKGYRVLQGGQAVTFKPFVTSRGNHIAASNIKPIGINIVGSGGNNGDNHN